MARAKSPWLFGPLLAGILFGATACRRDAVPASASARARAEEETVAGAALFEDVASSSGAAFTYRNGEDANHYPILAPLGGGVALIDYDVDGLPGNLST